MRTPVVRLGRGRAGLAAAALGAVVVLSGCGGTPTESPPTGVDGLTVPTPDPDPTDFVDAVDNPYFALAPGASWTYEAPDGGQVRLAVEGADDVDGVAVTVLLRTSLDPQGEVVGERRSSYAQDVDGNVWSFGREVVSGPGESWRAGQDGAEAGLLVPAEPRRGDGWLQQSSPSLTTRVEVLEVDAGSEALGEEVEVVVTRDRPQGGESDEPAVQRQYAAGLGIVRVLDDATGEVLLELTARTPGDG